MIKRTRRAVNLRNSCSPFTSPETEAVVQKTVHHGQPSDLCESIEFSPTAISGVRRLLKAGGTIITDTNVLAEQLNGQLVQNTQAVVKCFIDEAEVVTRAEQLQTTRAEMALDMALTIPGNKLLVIGSAPAALNRLLMHRRHEPLTDVCVLCTVNNFAGAVALKEKLRESSMAYILTRGKNGGVGAAADILSALLEYLTEV